MATLAPRLRSFTIALIQLGRIGSKKYDNLNHARDMIIKAADKKPDIIVLPECFNSPYGHTHFPVYAENIGFTPGKPYNVQESTSESVKMLSTTAKEVGTWLIGGSIPERDAKDGNVYNTCTVYNPGGELVAMHRKIHLFDIDIPGKIQFKESETLTGGVSLNSFDTGCHILIYPGAFNLTTGPLHWELLQRSRAVDNQVFMSMCSPARDMKAVYHAWGHSMAVDPMGRVICEGGEGEEILYADINVLGEARTGIPVSEQRRFDVYRDVSE
jgi:omega-amidase